MPEERLRSITSSSHLAPDDVARHTFGSVRRGFDPDEVRAYLESIAVGLRAIAERENQLLQEVADAEHRAANPVLDEAALTAALGTETARVLHSAHEAAAEMVAKAEAEATRILTEAHEEIERGPGPDRVPVGRAACRGRGGGRRAPRADRPAGRRPSWRRARNEADELLAHGPGAVPGHGRRGPGAPVPGAGRPGQAPEGAPRPDRAAAGRPRAADRDGPGRPPFDRRHRRGSVRRRGQRPAGRRGGRPCRRPRAPTRARPRRWRRCCWPRRPRPLPTRSCRTRSDGRRRSRPDRGREVESRSPDRRGAAGATASR